MDKDSRLIFETYRNKLINEDMPYPEFAKLSKHAASKLPEDKPKKKLKYDYEIVAYLPRDIDISTREGQDKVLNLAYKELVKRVTNKYKNPERAASNMFYDEDFPMELVSQYSHYQKHGFPDVEENAEEHDYREQMPDSREEYSAHDYAKEMEKDYKSQKSENEEKHVYDNIEVAFNMGGREYIAFGDVHFGQEDIHGKDEDTVENFGVIDARTKEEVQDKAVLRHGYNAVYNAGVNKSAEENAEEKPNYKAFNAFLDRISADVKKNGLSSLEKTPGMSNKQAVKHLQKFKKKEENAEDSAEDKMRDRENERDEKQRDAETS